MAENCILEEALAAFLALPNRLIVLPIQPLVDGAVYPLHRQPLLQYGMGRRQRDQRYSVRVYEQAEVMPPGSILVYAIEGRVIPLGDATQGLAEVNALLYGWDDDRRDDDRWDDDRRDWQETGHRHLLRGIWAQTAAAHFIASQVASEKIISTEMCTGYVNKYRKMCVCVCKLQCG
jgi:hypothetical protein